MLRFVALLAMAGLTAAGQVMKDPPLPLPGLANQRDAAVQFLSPEKITVPAHKASEVDLHFQVADGLHINSHKPLDKSLIPARLAVVETPGLNVTAVDFPPGTEYTLRLAPQQKLSVYSGEFVLRAHLTVQPGAHDLQGGLHYQACDANACRPPSTIPFSVTVVGK